MNEARYRSVRIPAQLYAAMEAEAEARGLPVDPFASIVLREAMAHLRPAEEFSLVRPPGTTDTTSTCAETMSNGHAPTRVGDRVRGDGGQT